MISQMPEHAQSIGTQCKKRITHTLTCVGVQGKKSGSIMPSVTKMTMSRQGSAMRHCAGLPLKNSVRARATCAARGGAVTRQT